MSDREALMAEMTSRAQEMTALRRRIHRRPELGWTEFETTWAVCETLRGLGWKVRAGREVIAPEAVLGRDLKAVDVAAARARAAGVPDDFLEHLEGYTGAIGEWDTGRPGPLTVLRFDMDCVAVEECHEAEHFPAAAHFDSEITGSMHACGHDVHTSAGLTLAHWVSDHSAELCGRFRFLFQPAEEGTRGGAAMAAAGLVDDADYFFGGHAGIVCKTGEAAVLSAGFFATCKIDIRFRGIPSHAGAAPEKGRSALIAAAAAALMIQGITRSGEGDTRVSIGVLRAGEGRNVTPVNALLSLEVRGETHEVNEFLVQNVRNMAEGAARAYGVEMTLEVVGRATTLITTPKGVELAAEAARDVYGTDHVRVLDAISGSEDCTTLMRRAIEHGADGAFLLYGCARPDHHQSRFDADEAADFPPALALFAELLKKTNGAPD